MFSGFYLPLFLILVALIARGVAFEYRGKRDDARWRARWDLAIFFGSLIPAILWGVAFANLVRGVPIEPDPLTGNLEFVGSFWGLLNPYALLGGLTTLSLFVTHGAVFIALKTKGDVRVRANQLAGRVGMGAAVVAVAFLVATQVVNSGGAVGIALSVLAAISLVGALLANRVGREGWAFIGSAVTIGLAVVVLFVSLYPEVMPSSIDPAFSLTTENASSTPYTLRIMTWVAVLLTPVVLLYQGWTFWVFRRRLGVEDIPAAGVQTPAKSHGQR
jgi:cytochrome d ubiquinol oxidase subunit II